MQRAMDKQAGAERERRIKLINADGEFPAAAKLAEAAVTVQLKLLADDAQDCGGAEHHVVFPSR